MCEASHIFWILCFILTAYLKEPKAILVFKSHEFWEIYSIFLNLKACITNTVSVCYDASCLCEIVQAARSRIHLPREMKFYALD